MDRGCSGVERLLHLDVCVDEKDPRAGVLQLLGRLRPQWTPRDIQMKTFTEGITNRLMGCFVGSIQEPGVVLVRVYGQMTELFVDRNREVEMFQVLHANGCGPQIYCSFQNGICYDFVRGSVLDDSLLSQPSIYRLIAAEMGRIHSIKPKGDSPVEPVLWKRMSQFLQLIQTEDSCNSDLQRGGGVLVAVTLFFLRKGRRVEEETEIRKWVHLHERLCVLQSPAGSTLEQEVPSIEKLSSEMESLKRHLSQMDSPTVLCHNDLLTKNIIYNYRESSVKFIDFEYADFNYQAFDIGNHFNEFAGVSEVDYSLYPSRELQRDWLLAYLKSYKHSSGQEVIVTEPEVSQLYVQVCKFSLASNFCWGLWAILQARHSSIDFDFQRYATARLNYYFEKKEEYFGLKLC
ncbi:ethanolamine kinase 1 [Aplochiton taeniatus]